MREENTNMLVVCQHQVLNIAAFVRLSLHCCKVGVDPKPEPKATTVIPNPKQITCTADKPRHETHRKAPLFRAAPLDEKTRIV